MATATEKKTVDLTTGVGIISFPHIFKETVSTNDKGEKVYDCQFLIPKSDRDTARAILAAIKEVGEAKWGDKWKQVRTPLRDGDKEKDQLTEDGSTKGEKYPERLGHWFINARSTKPIGVFDRQRDPIVDHDRVYAGCRVKIAVTFFPYSNSGNHGVGCGLNGVQFIADGEPIAGGGKPSVESMFDMLDDDDDHDLDADLDADEPEVEEPKPAKKAPAKKAAAKKAPAKKAAAKKPEPEPVDEDDDLDDIDVDEDEDDLLDDLDDLD
jgi:hypothetical protein